MPAAPASTGAHVHFGHFSTMMVVGRHDRDGRMTRTRRTLSVIGFVVLLLALAAAGLAFAFFRTFYPDAPVADYPPAADAATAQRQDFDYFRHYLEYDRSYAPAARARAQELLAEYASRAGSFSDAEFDLAIARMIALADNAHSRVQPGPLSRRHNRLPCRLYRFADGYHVLRARPACAELLGARIEAIDGRPLIEVTDRLHDYYRGPRNRFDQYISPWLLESPALLHAAGLAHAADRVTLRVTRRDGSEHELAIGADPPDADAPRVSSERYLSPVRIDKEATDWTALLPVDAPLPLFLRDPDTPFRSMPLDDPAIHYAQFRSNSDEPGHPIGPFIAHVEREIREARPRVVVLDLRFDQGGDFTKTAALMQDITTLADTIERVDVLTSAWTFSAGNVGVALAKQHGSDKVRVVGEPVGDRIRMWAEGGNLWLPNSKLALRYSTGLHDYSRSCHAEPGCFWVLYFFPTQVASLEPDVPADYTFGDYMALRDPLLDRAQAP